VEKVAAIAGDVGKWTWGDLSWTENVAAAGKAWGDIGNAAGRLRIERAGPVFMTVRMGDAKPFFIIEVDGAID
jgi:hypothetical protein